MVRRLRFAPLVTLTAVALLVFGVASASAVQTHAFSSSFGSSGSGAGQLSAPSAVAANVTTGDIYVADTANFRVAQFSSSGAFLRAWGWGVADGLPSFETCTLACQAGLPGSGAGQFTTPAFIAVDNSGGASDGDVYVGDTGSNLIQKFSASGSLVAAWGAGGQLDGSTATDGPFGPLAGIAVDNAGTLDVFDINTRMFEFAQDGTFSIDFTTARGTSSNGLAVDGAGNFFKVNGDPSVEEFQSDGTDIGQATASNVTTGLAADTVSGDLYVDTGASIEHYAFPACVPVPNVGCDPADSFGASNLNGAAGLAVDPASGTIYAADAGNDRIAVFGSIALPDVTTGSASNIASATATLNGTVNPAGVAVTDCHFAYVDDAHFSASAADPYAAGATVPCAEVAGAGTSDVAVHADLTGLAVGTTYHFRLQAANADGSSVGQDATFSTPPPPVITGASAINLTATAADLTARINPRGIDTTYHFEWGATMAYGTSIPVPDADIGAGTGDIDVSQHLTGLTAGTTYHFRVLATSASGTTTGADHTFVYGTSGQGLPDGRAYEQVTPVDKNGALIPPAIFFGTTAGVASDGEAVNGPTVQCFGDAGSCNGDSGQVGSLVRFTRTDAGWRAHALAPPVSLVAGTSLGGWDNDSGAGVTPGPTPPHGQNDFYGRLPDGSYVDIGPVTPPSGGALGAPTGGQAFTSDLSRFVYTLSPDGAQPEAEKWPFDATQTGRQSVYEYAGSGNTAPLLVGVSGGQGSTDLISTCQTNLGAALNFTIAGGTPNALSADGRVIFVTANGGDGCVGSGANAVTPVPVDAIYARVDNTTSAAHTVAISGRSPADCTTVACTTSSSADANFVQASVDGSKAVFLSPQQLTDAASEDDTPGDSAGNCLNTTGSGGCNLYVYDFTKPAGHELTAVSAGDSSGNGPRVRGVTAVSSDGSHIYFIAKGVLTAAPSVGGDVASEGANNLYVFDTGTGQTAFIARLPDSDKQFTVVQYLLDGSDFFSGYANATPDGRFLAFVSNGHLTPDDTSTVPQAFRYDAQSGALIRVSIGNNGFNDNGNNAADQVTIVPSTIGRTISDDGSRIFFQDPAALTPGALDNVEVGRFQGAPSYAQNVYEWHAGRVSLISDGRDGSAIALPGGTAPPLDGLSSVSLLGTDVTGSNVFFTSADRLVPQDTDTQLDYYDARIGGGIPYTPPPEPCSGDGCQGRPTFPPVVSTAASVTFNGPGNASPLISAPRTKAKLLSRIVHGSTFMLRISVPGKGRVTVSGAGVQTVRSAPAKAGTYRVRVNLTAKEKRALRHKRKLKVTIHIGYTPAGGASSAATVSLTVKA
ncbi:hypothetical protein [Baekduia sp.]|uniref:hypothetical protein n=1 Tax=Baekduia sp. TaxID=2600305 RepID=UPI002E01E3B5|nr:hypothetical protein [Baekduia sp.]